jgi:hypothetical protein
MRRATAVCFCLALMAAGLAAGCRNSSSSIVGNPTSGFSVSIDPVWRRMVFPGYGITPEFLKTADMFECNIDRCSNWRAVRVLTGPIPSSFLELAKKDDALLDLRQPDADLMHRRLCGGKNVESQLLQKPGLPKGYHFSGDDRTPEGQHIIFVTDLLISGGQFAFITVYVKYGHSDELIQILDSVEHGVLINGHLTGPA